MVCVELVYIPADKNIVHVTLDLKAGSLVRDALLESGIYSSHPETKDYAVGIYSKQVTLDAPLKEGDRLEIYRPLVLDPKETRRRRAGVK